MFVTYRMSTKQRQKVLPFLFEHNPGAPCDLRSVSCSPTTCEKLELCEYQDQMM